MAFPLTHVVQPVLQPSMESYGKSENLVCKAIKTQHISFFLAYQTF